MLSINFARFDILKQGQKTTLTL